MRARRFLTLVLPVTVALLSTRHDADTAIAAQDGEPVPDATAHVGDDLDLAVPPRGLSCDGMSGVAPLDARADEFVGTQPTRATADERRSWDVVDLVGHGSADGTVTAMTDGPPPPFTPGSLLGALKAAFDIDVANSLEASMTLAEGVLTCRLDDASLHGVGRVLSELRARAGSAYVVSAYVVDDWDVEIAQAPNIAASVPSLLPRAGSCAVTGSE